MVPGARLCLAHPCLLAGAPLFGQQSPAHLVHLPRASFLSSGQFWGHL